MAGPEQFVTTEFDCNFKVNISIAGNSCLNFSYLFMDPNLSLEKQSSIVWCHKDKLELRKLEKGVWLLFWKLLLLKCVHNCGKVSCSIFRGKNNTWHISFSQSLPRKRKLPLAENLVTDLILKVFLFEVVYHIIKIVKSCMPKVKDAYKHPLCTINRL